MFVDAAARLSGITSAILGWRPHEFWAATPAELATILSALTPPSEVAADGTTLIRLKELFPDG
jgi:Phage tail assembly chaperone protein, TAC